MQGVQPTSASAFLGLDRVGERSWRMPISRNVLTPYGNVQGGAVLAGAVEAMEGAAGRPLVWATGHFLGLTGPEGTLDIEVDVEPDGRQLSHASTTVRLGGCTVLTVAGALGSRSYPRRGRWAERPPVPPRAAAAPVALPGAHTGTLLEHVDIRIAAGRSLDELDGEPGAGRTALWCGIPGGPRVVSAGDLALLADLAVLGFPDALGVPCSGRSLDNTLRIVGRAASAWVLVAIEVQAVADGIGHAAVSLWSEDGDLLALANQSLALREPTARSSRAADPIR